MTHQDKKASGIHESSGMVSKETEKPANEAVLIERVELANPKPDQNVKDQADEQSLLPHEQDQTTGRQGTSQVNEDERSRAVIGQAAEDTKRGLKDTDPRGIPSDIIASDAAGSDAVEETHEKQ
ncbi:MAG: hypothetical protein ABJA60_02010 [Nitrosospira sp.]